MANKSLPELIIKPVVSIVCTAAICITGAVCVNKAIKNDAEASVAVTAELDNAYLTEAEAAAYLGISESRLAIMRKDLKYLEGAYMCYGYAEDGADVQVIMYQKDKLDAVIANIMKDKSSINFKFLEEAKAKSETAETK